MRYKLIARIQDGKNTIGFQVLQENNQKLNITKEQALQAAANGDLINVKYNKSSKSLQGINNTDLRKLPVIQQKKKESTKTEKKALTRHQRAKIFENKAKIQGYDIRFKCLKNDRVQLIRFDTPVEKIRIPQFVTDVGLHLISEDEYSGALAGTSYKEIFVDNDPDIDFDASFLCYEMQSKELKVKFKHPNKVTDMKSMFIGCEELTQLDISDFDTSNVTNMEDMFSECFNLTSLDLSGFDTGKVKNMSHMFYMCEQLSKVNVQNWDVSNVKDMSSLFQFCTALRDVDIQNWDVSNVKDMSHMFERCVHIQELVGIDKWNTKSLKYMREMFSQCQQLTQLNLSNWDVSHVVDIERAFLQCYMLTELNIAKWKLVSLETMGGAFQQCSEIKEIDLQNCRINKRVYMDDQFAGCENLKVIRVRDKATMDIIQEELEESGKASGVALQVKVKIK